tara:strand:+ start:289 stop:525 length:237 start_codon:yes stop_codon:yes gene_type:complete
VDLKDLKSKIKEAKKSTKVALVGGAIVIAGSWGSCQLNYSEHSTPAVEEAPAEKPEAQPPFGDRSEPAEEPEAEAQEG